MKRCIRVAFCFIVALAGCVSPQTRMQSAEESEREKDLDVHNVGEVTEVANVKPTQVSGVGLVTHLGGTGHTPPGQYRTMLEKYLLQNKIENPKAILDSPECALVLVNAWIPAGARKGDPLDLEVTLPPGSKATSLHGGYLQEFVLRDYNRTHNINPDFSGADRLLQGHIRAKA
jgi:flagellar basal body P-ring protein FlgI